MTHKNHVSRQQCMSKKLVDNIGLCTFCICFLFTQCRFHRKNIFTVHALNHCFREVCPWWQVISWVKILTRFLNSRRFFNDKLAVVMALCLLGIWVFSVPCPKSLSTDVLWGGCQMSNYMYVMKIPWQSLLKRFSIYCMRPHFHFIQTRRCVLFIKGQT